MGKVEQGGERRQEQKVQQNPEEIAEPAKKSDISPLEQAFDATLFAEVARDVEEDDRARRRENARVGIEIQAHFYRDSRLSEIQKSPVAVLSPNPVHAAIQSSKLRSDHVQKMPKC